MGCLSALAALGSVGCTTSTTGCPAGRTLVGAQCVVVDGETPVDVSGDTTPPTDVARDAADGGMDAGDVVADGGIDAMDAYPDVPRVDVPLLEVMGDTAIAADVMCPTHGAPGGVDPIDREGFDSNCDGVDGIASDEVFVSLSGHDPDAGGGCLTPATACRTIGAGIAAAVAAHRHTVLLQSGTYNEAVSEIALSTGISLAGGYVALSAATTGDAGSQSGVVVRDALHMATEIHAVGAFALTLDQLGTGCLIDGITLHGEAPATGNGQSAYAARVRGVAVQFNDVVFDTGNGQLGAAGLAGTTGTQGGNGTAGLASDCAAMPAGGMPATGCSTSSVHVAGGAGGHGGNGVGTAPQAGATAGGMGGAVPGMTGAVGSPGTPGSAGMAATALMPQFVFETGYSLTNMAGFDNASAGSPGTGGGGGGGGNGLTVVCGATGSGGGAGGCGGGPGHAGQGGGSSVGLIVADGAMVGLTGNTTFAIGSGGTGGTGGSGGGGGSGGTGGTQSTGTAGLLPGGLGGVGGTGGAGGPGAGGNGGSSFAVVRLGGTVDMTTIHGTVSGAGGQGPGGSGGGPPGLMGLSRLFEDLGP